MAGVSKEEYLKRYLSVNAEEKKKKKRKKVHGQVSKLTKSRIVDDDVDLKSLLPSNLSNTLEEDVGDNDPTVAEIIDERPKHVQLLEKYRTSRAWKLLGQDGNSRNSSDSDMSPKIKQRHDSASDESPKRRQRHDSNSDQSPLRRKRHDSDSDQSPSRRQRHDSDQSPPRKKRHESHKLPSRRQRHDSDQSPQRRQRHNSDSDQSPPRKPTHESHKLTSRRQRHDSDQSPPRRQRHNSDSDQSPPRKQRHYSDKLPPRRQRRDSDSDQSPPRKSKQTKTETNFSERRFKSRFSDIHPKKQQNSDKLVKGRPFPNKPRHDSDSDESQPKRRTHASDSDQSPPRRRKQDSDSDQSPPRKGKRDEKVEKTLGGKKAGLSSAKQMRLEADELKKKEDEKFRQISDDRLGKGAKTVFRDKSGKRRDLEQERQQESEEAKKQAIADEKFQKWGKGLKQMEDKSKMVEEALHEVNKPLARYKDDDDLDQMLREQDRAEDPMLAFIKKKKKTSEPVKQKPKYKGPNPPPNRFGILPGYRWDGVNRSNGFEKQIYNKQADKTATADQAYKWSVEDM